jgi:nucleoside-diphosphate kinase
LVWKLKRAKNRFMDKEKTLVLLKPDAVQRSLIGEIVSRFERVGLKIIALKFLIPNKDQAYKHYVKNEAEIEALGKRSIEGKKKSGIIVTDDPKILGQKIVDRLVKFLTAGPVVAFVLEGNQAVAITRKLIGSTEPLQSDVGTVRGDYTIDSYALADDDDRSVRNLIHASANVPEAGYEIKVWFEEKDLVDYKNVLDKVLYDVNLDTIPE